MRKARHLWIWILIIIQSIVMITLWSIKLCDEKDGLTIVLFFIVVLPVIILPIYLFIDVMYPAPKEDDDETENQ